MDQISGYFDQIATRYFQHCGHEEKVVQNTTLAKNSDSGGSGTATLKQGPDIGRGTYYVKDY